MQKLLAQSIASTLPPQAGDEIQYMPPPIINGVPKLLFTDEEVAAMFGLSVSTVRNRYDVNSRWYDSNFPVPRSTDGSGKGRKAAVRWFWADLCLYAASLPRVPGYLHPLGKSVRHPKAHSAASNYGTKPDIKSGGDAHNSSSERFDI